MATPYPLGQWTTLPGREHDLVAAWQDLAEWTDTHLAGSGWAKLLPDREEPRRFINFGPWQDDDAVAAWREHDGFRTRNVAAQIGPATPDP